MCNCKEAPPKHMVAVRTKRAKNFTFFAFGTKKDAMGFWKTLLKREPDLESYYVTPVKPKTKKKVKRG